MNVIYNDKVIDHIEVSSYDFLVLSNTSCEIPDNFRSNADRFICNLTDKPLTIDPKATTAYWFERYADVIFARHFLIKNGFICQIALDEDYKVGFVIFTNFEV